MANVRSLMQVKSNFQGINKSYFKNAKTTRNEQLTRGSSVLTSGVKKPLDTQDLRELKDGEIITKYALKEELRAADYN